MNGVFKLIEEKFGIEVFYIAEELAMGIFEGNDTEGRFFTDRYILMIQNLIWTILTVLTIWLLLSTT